jgi:hypothetical protein
MGWDGDRTNEIIDVIKQYCEEDGIKYRQMDERTILAGFQGRNFSYQLHAREREGQQQAIFISVAPVKVQPELRSLVAEYLCRANFGLILGNCELDFETGEVRYKTSVDVEGGALTTAMVKTLLHVNLSTIDKYAKGLIGILYRGLSPAQAIAEIEEVSATKRLAAQAAMN